MARKVKIMLDESQADALRTILVCASAQETMDAANCEMDDPQRQRHLSYRERIKGLDSVVRQAMQSPVPTVGNGTIETKTGLKDQVEFMRSIQTQITAGRTTPTIVKMLREWLGEHGYEPAYQSTVVGP